MVGALMTMPMARLWSSVAIPGSVFVLVIAAAAGGLAQPSKPPMSEEAYARTMKDVQSTFRSL